MDPNATLNEIRLLVKQIITLAERWGGDDDSIAPLGCDLAETVRDLDDWISKGGFLPSDWDDSTREDRMDQAERHRPLPSSLARTALLNGKVRSTS